MPDAIVENPPAEQADKDTDALNTAQYLAQMYPTGLADQSKVDAKVVDATVKVVVAELPKIYSAQRSEVKAKEAICAEIISLRNAITLPNGEPDTFGTSDAYRLLYERRIKAQVRRAHPELSLDWITEELGRINTNYLNWSSKGSKGMLVSSLVDDAFKAGQLPEGTVKSEDGLYIVPVMTTKKVDGKRQIVQATDKDGAPKVATYRAGQKADVPAAIKTVVKDVYAKRTTLNKNNKPNATPPPWMGGPEKGKPGTGGNTPKDPDNPAEAFSAALGTITKALPQIVVPEAIRAFHAAGSNLLVTSVFTQEGAKAPDDRAQELRQIGDMFTTAAAILAGKAERASLDAHLYVPSDDDGKAVPAVDAPEAPDAEQDAEQAPEQAS